MYLECIEKELKGLKKKHLSRKLLRLEVQNQELIYHNQSLIDFASNDYLGLAQNPKIQEQLKKQLNHFPTGGRSSPLVLAHTQFHDALAHKFAQRCGKETALLFSSAYSANVGVIAALGSISRIAEKKLVFQDKLNHASLIDGARLSDAELIRFKHLDYGHLEKRLDQLDAKNHLTLIVSDHIFSMDGDRADLSRLVALKQKYGALLLIDDAHGFAMNHGVQPEWLTEIDIYSVSFAKALGGNGAFIATNHLIAEYLLNQSRSFIYSTAINPILIELANLALDFIDDHPTLNEQLEKNIIHFTELARQYDLRTLPSKTPIQAVLVQDNERCIIIQQELLKRGLAVGAIRSPTVPKQTERLRISIHAHHKPAEIELLCQSIQVCFQQLGMN